MTVETRAAHNSEVISTTDSNMEEIEKLNRLCSTSFGSPVSETSWEDQFQYVKRPFKALPRRLSGKDKNVNHGLFAEIPTPMRNAQSMKASETAPQNDLRHVQEADLHTTEFSGNFKASPASPTHAPSFYQPLLEKQGLMPSDFSLVDEFDQGLLRYQLDSRSSHDGAHHRPQTVVSADSINIFKFKELPPSVLNDGFYYRQRAAQLVLLCTGEAKSAKLAMLNRLSATTSLSSTVPASLPAESPKVASEASIEANDESRWDETDGAEDSGAEFTWSEHSGNKKKRKSARSSNITNSVNNYTTTSRAIPYAVPVNTSQFKHHINHSNADTQSNFERSIDDGDTEALSGRHGRLVMPKIRVPYSLRCCVNLRQQIRNRYNNLRLSRDRLRLEQLKKEAEALEARAKAEEENQARLAAEKKPQKRMSRAEKRVQALRSGSGAPKTMSIAAIRARAGQNNNGNNHHHPLVQNTPSHQSYNHRHPINHNVSYNQAQAHVQIQSTPLSTPTKQPHNQPLGSSATPPRSAVKPDSVGQAEPYSPTQRPITPPGTLSAAASESDSATPVTSFTPKLAPQSPFSFCVDSPITRRLEQLRVQMDAVSLKLSDSLFPPDLDLVKAMDRISMQDSTSHNPTALATKGSEAEGQADDDLFYQANGSNNSKPSHLPTAFSPLRHSNLDSVRQQGRQEAMETNQTRLNPISSPLPHGTAAAASLKSPVTTHSLNVSPVVPAASPPKPSNRKKKTATNNQGHSHSHSHTHSHSNRSSHGPSRLNSDTTRRNGSRSNTHVDSKQRPGLDHPTTTCGLFDGEWMCLFCEYELLYGEPPLMLRACKNRKKVVSKRKTAQARANSAANGILTKRSSAGHHHDHDCGHDECAHNHVHDHDYGNEHGHYNPDSIPPPHTRKAIGTKAKSKSKSKSSPATVGHPCSSITAAPVTRSAKPRERCSCGNSIHDSDEYSEEETCSLHSPPTVHHPMPPDQGAAAPLEPVYL